MILGLKGLNKLTREQPNKKNKTRIGKQFLILQIHLLHRESNVKLHITDECFNEMLGLHIFTGLSTYGNGKPVTESVLPLDQYRGLRDTPLPHFPSLASYTVTGHRIRVALETRGLQGAARRNIHSAPPPPRNAP